MFCFKASVCTTGLSSSSMASYLQRGWYLDASGRQWVTLLKHRGDVLEMSLLSRSCWLLLGEALGNPNPFRACQRPASGSNHMIIAQWGGRTPLSLPPVCSSLETLAMRPDIVLTNALQGPSPQWARGNDLEDVTGLFHLEFPWFQICWLLRKRQIDFRAHWSVLKALAGGDSGIRSRALGLTLAGTWFLGAGVAPFTSLWQRTKGKGWSGAAPAHEPAPVVSRCWTISRLSGSDV